MSGKTDCGNQIPNCSTNADESRTSKENGNETSINGSTEAILTPELLYNMNKKIAQLTKVVYGLNTRGEELEAQLTAARDNEEKTRALNTDLQHRVNNFKTKIEAEMMKLRELETQSNQSQFWKMECDKLKRRLDTESGVGDSIIALSLARDEIDQCRIREKSIQYDLDQARHTITNLKAHHEFIMRERDGQEVMEREKVILEWQTRLVEMEARYKSQARRATDDVEAFAEECAILRRRSQSIGEEGSVLHGQMTSMQFEFDEERKDLKRKLRQQSVEMGDGRGEIIELQRKLHVVNEERRKTDEKWEESNRMTSERYDARIRDLITKCDFLQQIDHDRDEVCERRVRSKLSELRQERDITEEGYKVELRNLKQQNELLQTEVKALRYSVDKTGIEYVNRVQELEEALADKSSELDLKSKNFKVRLNMLENKTKQMVQEKVELEKQFVDERERYKQMRKTQEGLTEKAKEELQERLRQIEETEKSLKENCSCLVEVNEVLKMEIEELRRKVKEKEREGEDKLEREKSAVETRVRLKLERTWLERLTEKEELATLEMQKAEEEWRKRDEIMKKELEKVSRLFEGAKRGNEDFRKKIRDMRQQELETNKKVTILDNSLVDMRKKEELSNQTRKELESQSVQYQQTIDNLNIKITQENAQSTRIRRELEEAKKDSKRLARDLEDSRKKNSSTAELEIKIHDLNRQFREKDAVAESVRADLQYAKNESEICKSKVRRLEEEVKNAAEKTANLEKEIALKSNDGSRISELEAKIKRSEEDIHKKELTIKDLQTSLESIEDERDEEMKIVQDALDEAAEEREDLIKTFRKELEGASTKNTAREQQMLEDFEWKLRETQKENKEKLDEKDKRCKNTMSRKKHYEEEDQKHKIEKLRREITTEWEDRLSSECSQQKSDLESAHARDKSLVVEALKEKNEREMLALKKAHEIKEQETNKEMSNLKSLLAEKEANYQNEYENLRTSSDRDIWELRKKLQKLDDAAYDKEQQMLEKHKEEIERLRDEHEAHKAQATEAERRSVTSYYENSLKSLQGELTEIKSLCNQYRETLESTRSSLIMRNDTINSLNEKLEKLERLLSTQSSNLPMETSSTSGYGSSQFSLGSPYDSQDKIIHQDRLSSSDPGTVDGQLDSQRGSGGSLLGKVFGGSWFGSSKSKDCGGRRGSSPLVNKRSY